jgi:hypothetical protein
MCKRWDTLDIIPQLITLLGGEDLDLLFHKGMQNTHDLKEGTAETGEFRNDEDIVLVHTRNERA